MGWIRVIDQGDGWFSGARSVAEMPYDGEFSFTVGQSTGIIVGLNDTDLSPYYTEITHGFFIEDKLVSVIENGFLVYVYDTELGIDVPVDSLFTDGQVFKIRRFEGVVKYFIDSVLLYTSQIPSEGTVFLDCSMYLAGDSIVDMEFTELSEPRIRESLKLSPLAAFGREQGDGCRASFLPLKLNIEYDISVKLSPLKAFIRSNENAALVKLLPLDLSSKTLKPNVNYGKCVLAPLETNDSVIDTCSGELSLSPLNSFATDTDYICFAVLSPIESRVFSLIDNTFLIYLPSLTGGISLTTRFGIHQVWYGTNAQSLHRVSYEGTTTVINLHESQWSQQALSLHLVEWSDSALVSTFAIHESSWASIGSSSAIALNESYWQSVGSSSIIALHESSWSSLLRSTAQAAQEAFYGTIGTSTLIGLHEAGWASVGGLASVMGLHELGWSFTPSAMSLQSASFKSVIETRSLHEVYYETYQTSVIMTLHECRYRSNQVTPIINTGLIYARI